MSESIEGDVESEHKDTKCESQEHKDKSDKYKKKTQEINEKKKIVTDDFKKYVLAYVKYDDAIREKQMDIKELKDKKKTCEEAIIKHMGKDGENIVNLGVDGKLTVDKKEKIAPLKPDIIRDAIKTKIKDDKKIDEIMIIMDEKRGKSNTVLLKRTKAKKERTKKVKKDKDED